ncbi:family 43 glycosylhydrolase [Glycomyces xiaoerkulensis]|uniref:family 43 glycosylhydrolase n=1 Tax=Glycomyces xiaoerkulensis TaxID=2038139 RepID=UPI000C267E9F|nr:family 43 glycosylhydrolase [Glycomyces xiaoerkulensis]
MPSPLISRRRLFQAAGAAAIAAAAPGLHATAAHAAGTPAVTYHNALIQQRADPQIWKHSDGYYYFTASVPEYDRIIMRRSTTLQGLASAQEVTVWWKHDSGPMSHHIWAPEIHHIDGRWYIYFAAGEADDIWRIRMYVLESTSSDPTSGGWTELGQITTPRDSFSLDATTFTHNGARYLCWAQSDPDVSGGGTSLFLATMSNPWTLSSSPVRISMPTYDWERVGHNVNEGAYVIKRNGRIFMTYSASATDANYSVGLLTASESANLLDPASWSKNPEPVLQSHDGTGQYGPGHNAFTVSEDGQSDIMVYHARPYEAIDGDPLYDPNRHTRLQKIYWNDDGTPSFGIPVADGQTPYRFLGHGGQDLYLNHYEYRLQATDSPAMLSDSQFRIVSGLSGSGTVSLESANFPGRFLRHRDYEFWLDENDGSSLYGQDASFYERAGLADSAGVSFESVNFSGYYLRHRDGLAYLEQLGSAQDESDATFYLE